MSAGSSCLSADGEPVTRYFLGAASFGLSASIARAMGRARIARLFGHRFAASPAPLSGAGALARHAGAADGGQL